MAIMLNRIHKGKLIAVFAVLALMLGGSLMKIPFAHADTAPSGSQSVIYVNGSAGDDSQAGDSAASAVKTFEKALALASANATIIVLDTVSVPSGTYDLKGLTIERGEGNANALLAVDSADVTLNASGAKVDGKGASADAPLIAVTSSTLNMSGVTVTGGHNSNDPRRGGTKEETIPADSWVSLGGGLGAKGSTINIANTTFTGNQATLGGAVFSDASTVNVKSGAKFDANEAKWDKASEHPDTKTYRADTTLPNGRALYAEGHAAGGAIMATSVYGVSTINVEDGAAFTNNVAPSGGAIATGRTEVGFGDKDDIQQYAMNTGGNTQVNITGGDFTGNTVKSAGGALFIQSNSTATVTGGKFTNNHADGIETQFSGGAIYVQDKKTQSYGHVYDIQIDQPGKLILKNALLTGNKAGEFGGALALCSTAEGYVAANEGAAIFDNTMDRVWWKKAGDTPTAIPSDHDDIVLFIKERGQIVSVSDYAIGNVVNDWDVIRGGTTQGFVGEEDGINAGMMTVHNDPYFLGNTLSDADKAAARANARVIFENNSTNSNGGALSINGIVEIGSPVGAFYIKKVDEENGEALGGAQFQLTGPNGFIKTVTLPTQDEYVRGNLGARKGVSAFRDLMPGEYTLTETKAPEGYPEHRSTWKISVGNQDDGYPIVITDEEGNKIASSDSVSEVGGELVIDVYNLANNKNDEVRYPVEISKQELGDDTKELPGAEIKITDSEGHTVDEWTSTDESHKLSLEAGEYELEEVNAPEGFEAITTKIRFKVDENGKVSVLNAEEVTGGKVSVKDVNHLILEDMPKKPEEHDIVISKNSLGGSEIAGAQITLTDSEGNTVDEWTSTTEAHTVKLPAGEYTMEEVVAPEGYAQVTTKMKFTVHADGTVTLITTKVNNGGKISVTDGNHVVLEDAPLGGNIQVTKTWKNANQWTIPGGANMWPADVTVTVTVKNAQGDVLASDTLTADKRSVVFDKDNDGNPFIEGVEYIVEEEISSPVASIEAPQTVTPGDTVVFTNSLMPRKSERFVLFNKVDPDGKELAGAELEITGTTADGVQIDPITWVSDGTLHRVEGLLAGEYTLTEKKAPQGYDVAQAINFRILEGTGELEIQNADGDWVASTEGIVTMIDELTPTEDKPTPPSDKDDSGKGDAKPSPETTTYTPIPTSPQPLSNTGAAVGITVLVAFALMLAGGIATAMRRRTK